MTPKSNVPVAEPSTECAAARLPPRERILSVARDLFYQRGIRAVGVEEIADAAGTNKMTLYRHFASKDELIAECLRASAEEANAGWDKISAAHKGNPRAELSAWLASMADHILAADGHGCALANAAVELKEDNHPARRVVEEVKCAQRNRLVRLCGAARLQEPEFLADELFLLLEGARISAQSVGRSGPAARLVRMGEAIIASHAG